MTSTDDITEVPVKSQSNANSTDIGDCRRELTDLLKKKHELELNLVSLEKQIYKFEESYLDETQAFGNVIKGWDAYLASNIKSTPSNQKGDKKVKKWKDSDRLFSKSSATYEYALRASTGGTPGKENRCLDDFFPGRKSESILTPSGSPSLRTTSSKKAIKRPK